MRVTLPALRLCLLHLKNPRESTRLYTWRQQEQFLREGCLETSGLTAPRTACQLVVLFPLQDQSTWNQDDLLWHFPDAISSKPQRRLEGPALRQSRAGEGLEPLALTLHGL